MVKPVVLREQANQDVDDALAWYLNEQAEAAALGLINALEQAYGHISRHPATGSPRFAHELNLPGLRVWPLKRYPYFVRPEQRTNPNSSKGFQPIGPVWICKVSR